MDVTQIYHFAGPNFNSRANEFLHANYSHLTVTEVQTSEAHIAIIGTARPAVCDELWRSYLNFRARIAG